MEIFPVNHKTTTRPKTQYLEPKEIFGELKVCDII